MKTRFVISDTHFSHENSWKKFKVEDGSPLRPFTSTEEMDETMVENWNRVVGPYDVVYHLGDVAIAKKGLEFIKRLNGRKRLIRGNHDIFRDKDYYEAGFEQIHGVRVFVDQWIMSHIPLHPDSVTERFRANVHGHLHNNRVLMPDNTVDPRYVSACVELNNFTPISFDDLEKAIQEQWKNLNYVPVQGYFNGSTPS